MFCFFFWFFLEKLQGLELCKNEGCFFFLVRSGKQQCCDVIGNGMGREGKGKGFLMIGSFSSSNERYMYIHIVYVK